MHQRIVVIGGANIDIMATANHHFYAKDSNPGTVHKAFGGVGRNIAENLARLGHDVTFITALPKSEDGVALKRALEGLGVFVHAVETSRMPSYVALYHAHGELIGAVADMASLEALDEEAIDRMKRQFAGATLIIDANLSNGALQAIFRHARNVFADAVSAQKALKLKPYLSKIHTLKLNRQEFEMFVKTKDNVLDETSKAFVKHEGLVQCVLSEGAKGVRLIHASHVYHRVLNHPQIVNVSGAGDALFSGIIHATLENKDSLLCGLALASITLEAAHAVSKNLTRRHLYERMEALR